MDSKGGVEDPRFPLGYSVGDSIYFKLATNRFFDCVDHNKLENSERIYAEYIMRNAGMEEAQAGIKIAGSDSICRYEYAHMNMNSHRYADDTSFMAESEEELKGFLMKVKEESEKVA